MKTSRAYVLPPYVRAHRLSSGRVCYRVEIPGHMVSKSCPVRSGPLATNYEEAMEKYDRFIRPALIAFRRKKTLRLVSSRP
jgi:hypothetical protein